MTTAIYPNRVTDKEELEITLGIPEDGNGDASFYLPSGELFAKGYVRIVYGDHGPYLEFDKCNIKAKLRSKFNNKIDLDNLPREDYSKFYYYWLYPVSDPDIKVYLQIKPVTDLPNAPRRPDHRPSAFGRKEGYADYRRGYIYIDPYMLKYEKK